MTHSTHQHLEHVEHTQHAIHDPFNNRVALSMAIVAAVLAAVTILSHREHNATLRYQTAANVHHTLASDQWGYFQAKKNRAYLYEAMGTLLTVTAKDSGDPKAADRARDMSTDWKKKSEKYLQDSDKIEEKANDLVKEAAALQEESEAAERRALFYDLGELGVDLSLVLCSVAMLSKLRLFWYTGLLVGVIGVCIAGIGLLKAQGIDVLHLFVHSAGVCWPFFP